MFLADRPMNKRDPVHGFALKACLRLCAARSTGYSPRLIRVLGGKA